MLDFGLGYKDWTRIVWTFLMAAGGWMLAAWTNAVPGQVWDWKAVAVGAFAAGLSAIKNFALSDSSPIK